MAPILLADETFWEANGDWISAAISLIVAFAFAFAVDRFVIRRAPTVAARVGRGDVTVSRAAKTRLRVIRRLVFVTIIVIGGRDRAQPVHEAQQARDRDPRLERRRRPDPRPRGPPGARQPAGRDPARGHAADPDRRHGHDRRRDRAGRRPHALLHVHRHRRRAAGDRPERAGDRERRSSTARPATRARPAMASVWVPPDADLARAREALAALDPSQVDVAEITPDGIRIEVHGPRRAGGTRRRRRGIALRERAQRGAARGGAAEQRHRYPFLTLMGARARRRRLERSRARSARRSCWASRSSSQRWGSRWRASASGSRTSSPTPRRSTS